jgi:type I restriction enzyme M protein
MPQAIKLSDLLRDSAYKLTQFKASQIQTLEASITMKEVRGTLKPQVKCLVRNK